MRAGGHSPSYGEPWTLNQRDRLREIVLSRRRASSRPEGLTGHPRLWAPELQQILVDLERMLDDDNAGAVSATPP